MPFYFSYKLFTATVNVPGSKQVGVANRPTHASLAVGLISEPARRRLL